MTRCRVPVRQGLWLLCVFILFLIYVVHNRKNSEERPELLLQGNVNMFKQTNACEWPPIQLHGRQKINKTIYSFKKLEEIYNFMEDGHYRPSCQPYQKIAIIVPYRLREKQLKIFINNVIPRIYRQKQEFTIYLVEQADTKPFNRGMLANIGYQNALADQHFDCIVVHDVDMLPEDDRNLYFCSNRSVYHLAGKRERYNYSLLYPKFAGGITSLSILQYKDVNGFSNAFCGWGGEDDDFEQRINSAGYNLKRPLMLYSHCGEVEHQTEKPNAERYVVMNAVRELWKTEGLNSLQYHLIKKENKKLFKWIYVNTNCTTINCSTNIGSEHSLVMLMSLLYFFRYFFDCL